MKLRVALVISHPIQHFCPQYVSFSRSPGIHFKVFFASKLGLEKYVDQQFGQEVSWGNLQLEKFDHLFLSSDVVQIDRNTDAPLLDKALDDFCPDLVICYGYYQRLQRRAKDWAVRNGVKLAYISDSERKQKRSVIKELIKWPILWKYFRRFDFFLTVGNSNEDFYKFHGVSASKFIRMHFPIDKCLYEESYRQRADLRRELRNNLGIDMNQIVICVVGKLVGWKNQDHIIDALVELEKQGICLDALIVGSGEKLEEWKHKAGMLRSSRVIFTGFVDISQLPAYYAASDIYVHPASIEPHSIAISEAVFMGNPVILSDRCGSYGSDDDVREELNGYVYSFGKISELTARVKELILNPNLLHQMSFTSHEIGIVHQERAHKLVIEELSEKLGSYIGDKSWAGNKTNT